MTENKTKPLVLPNSMGHLGVTITVLPIEASHLWGLLWLLLTHPDDGANPTLVASSVHWLLPQFGSERPFWVALCIFVNLTSMPLWSYALELVPELGLGENVPLCFTTVGTGAAHAVQKPDLISKAGADLSATQLVELALADRVGHSWWWQAVHLPNGTPVGLA